jgi:hypothetical protein
MQHTRRPIKQYDEVCTLFFFFFFLIFSYAFSGVGFFSFYLWSHQTFGRTLWAGDQSSAKASTFTGQHNTEKHRHISMPPAGFEPAIPMFERPKTVLPLDRAAIETGVCTLLYIKSTSHG